MVRPIQGRPKLIITSPLLETTMKLKELIRKLQRIERDFIRREDAEKSAVSIEAVNDNGEIYYETNFDLFVDDNNDIGLSPVSK